MSSRSNPSTNCGVWRVLIALLIAISPIRFVVADEPASISDYRHGFEAAKQANKMLLIAFYEPSDAARWDELIQQLEQHPPGKQGLAKHVVVRLPTSYEFASVEKKSNDSPGDSVAAPTKLKLLDHPAFGEMQHRPGWAVLDLTDPKSRHFQYVVSVLPAASGSVPTLEHSLALLDLPTGSLTQRTMIFAVRSHAAAPQSTAGTCSSVLLEETESHAQHSANINLQGHHHWENRFHRINAKLPGGLLAQEVCAESWPGQNLLEAARECVHSWSQSPGHWSAVHAHQPLFGYDMKRGSNGVWYGVGIFGRSN